MWKSMSAGKMATAGVISLLILLAGCDLGTYERRRASAMSTVTNRATTAAASMTIPAKGGAGTGISFMLPQIVGKSTDIKAIAGPLNVDGLAGMYEAPTGNGGGPMLLLGGVPIAEGPMDKVVGNVSAALQAAAGQAPQPSDVRPTIKRLVVVGPQKFSIGGAEQTMPGRTEAYVISSASHFAILIFRVSDANDANKAFEGQIQAAIGSIGGDAAAAGT